MKCGICGRENLTQLELRAHTKVFHKVGGDTQKIPVGVCPDCGTTLWFEEGCATCHTCGYSKCS